MGIFLTIESSASVLLNHYNCPWWSVFLCQISSSQTISSNIWWQHGGGTIPYLQHSHYDLENIVWLQAGRRVREVLSGIFNAVAAETRLQKPEYIAQVLEEWHLKQPCRHSHSIKLRGQRSEMLPFYSFDVVWFLSITMCFGAKAKNNWQNIWKYQKFLLQHFCFFFNRAEKCVCFSIWSNIIGEITKSVLEEGLFSTDSVKPCPCISLGSMLSYGRKRNCCIVLLEKWAHRTKKKDYKRVCD